MIWNLIGKRRTRPSLYILVTLHSAGPTYGLSKEHTYLQSPHWPLPLLPSSNANTPHWPTSSVFSPNYCLSTSFSTTHNLFDVSSPTLSCSSPGLGGLPPRSPIHRERERRRLRKKSPPPGIGGNIIKAGLLARARNNEELERTREDNAFGHGDRNEDEDDDDVLIHSMPPPASHHHQPGTMSNSPASPGSAARRRGGLAVLRA